MASKIELSLESNINSIIASGLTGYKLAEKELDPIIIRIAKNFQYHYCKELADTAVSLWNASQDRKHVHSILSTTYEIEMDWRSKNAIRSMLKTLTNPHSYEPIPFSYLLSLNVPSEIELKSSFQSMSDPDFRSTPYFRSVASTTIQFYGGECQTRINDIQCGRTRELSVYYLSKRYERGLEHRHYATDLTVICKDCLIRHQGGDESGEVSHKMGISVR